jgi:hypothetical protein
MALQRARKRLRVQTEARGFPRRSYWSLLSSGTTPGETLCTGTTGMTGTTVGQSSQSSHAFSTPRARETTGEDDRGKEADDAFRL